MSKQDVQDEEAKDANHKASISTISLVSQKALNNIDMDSQHKDVPD